METSRTVAAALLVCGLVALAYPVVDPVEPQLLHHQYNNPDLTREEAFSIENNSDTEVIYYSNLSGRAKTVYDRAVESAGEYGGKYWTAVGNGADRYNYSTTFVKGQVFGHDYIIIHRNASSSPDYSRGEINTLETKTVKPPLLSTPYLLRGGALLLGIGLLAGGGYLWVTTDDEA